MLNHKNVFFIKEGPKEVNFDIEKVFLEDTPKCDEFFNFYDLKSFIEERISKLEEVSKERHSEFIKYIDNLKERISKIEYQSFDYNSQLDINSSEVENLLNIDKTITSFTSLSDNKSLIDAPNILDQEELDALLADVGDVSDEGLEVNLKNFSESSVSSDSENEINENLPKKTESENKMKELLDYSNDSLDSYYQIDKESNNLSSSIKQDSVSEVEINKSAFTI